MSIEALAAVLNMDFGDSTRKLVALGLANHADRDGSNAWPAMKTLADYANCSTRTAQRHVAALLSEGFIREGDQGKVTHLDPRRRPIVYDVALSQDQARTWRVEGSAGPEFRAKFVRGDNLSPQDSVLRGDTDDGYGVTPVTSRGDTAVSSKPSLNHPENRPSLAHPVSTSPEAPGGDERDAPVRESQLSLIAPTAPAPARRGRGFEEFWMVCPRKVGKKAALKAWETAIKGGADPDTVAQAMTDAAKEWQREGRAERFIPHPATWLNAGRWEDEASQVATPSYWDGVPRAADLPDWQTG